MERERSSLLRGEGFPTAEAMQGMSADKKAESARLSTRGQQMTGEEVERAIEFLLTSQAKHDAQIAELHNIIREQATSQSELNQAMTKAITDLAEAQQRTVAKVNETDARLDRLSEVVERLAARGE
jgi:predicted  nucleic acid-binding Zn-ribbon protein